MWLVWKPLSTCWVDEKTRRATLTPAGWVIFMILTPCVYLNASCKQNDKDLQSVACAAQDGSSMGLPTEFECPFVITISIRYK